MSSLPSKAVTAASTFARRLGGALDSLGSKLEVAKVSEKLVPSTRFVAYENSLPSATGAFVLKMLVLDFVSLITRSIASNRRPVTQVGIVRN